MNDIEFVYRQDIAEKKRIAAGSHHKNLRGKGRPIMQSDKLSRKEIQDMSSKVEIWQMKPYTEDEFDELSDKAKVSYLNWIISEFNTSVPRIANDMLKCSTAKVNSVIYRLRKLGYKIESSNGKRLSIKQLEKWRIFCIMTDEPPAENGKEERQEEKSEKPKMTELNGLKAIKLKGNIESIIASLRMVAALCDTEESFIVVVEADDGQN